MNSPAATPDRVLQGRVLTGSFATLATEVPTDVVLSVVEGQLPRDLVGTLLRNGPGRAERGGVAYGHPFDGDGFLQRFAFDGHAVSYRARFVQTREFAAEEAAGRMLYRGFGTNRPGGLRKNLFRMRFKNAANTSVVQHAGHTLALWEGGIPHRIDPDTLQTLGRFTYGGALEARGLMDRVLAPERPFSAHPRLDPETGELWNFGTAYGLTHKLLIYRVDAQGTLHTRTLPMKALPFVHDMALTRRFAIVVLPATRFDVPATLLGLKTPVASLQLDDAPGEAWLVPRNGGEPVRIPVPPGFVFHWAHAHEDGDHVILEGVKYDGFPALDGLDRIFDRPEAPELLARPIRLTLDLSTGAASESALAPHAMELPSALGAGADRVLVGVGAPPERRHPFLSCVVRIDEQDQTTLRDFAPHLPGEPVAAGPYLLVPLYRHEAPALLAVLSAADLSTVACLELPHPVPSPLHGLWVPGA